MKAPSTIFYITLVFPQSEKSDLEALCQTKDKILEARATENQQQAEIIQQLEVLLILCFISLSEYVQQQSYFALK